MTSGEVDYGGIMFGLEDDPNAIEHQVREF